MSCQHTDVSVTERIFKDGTKHLERRCKACRKHLGYAAQNKNGNLPSRLPFGKHKGKTFDAVAEEDPDYLKWMLEQAFVRKNLRRKIEAALERYRTQTTPKPITTEEEHALLQLHKMRTMGLDFFNKPHQQ